MIPRLIHLIYFPWDRNHRLKPDENDFDHGPCEVLRRYASGFEVRLWTFSAIRDFCLRNYPDVWSVVERCPHPTMMVDVLRWLVVRHFGGIYWQMSTTPLAPMDAFLPSPGKSVRLFTEFVLTPEQCRAMAAEPIRRGEPEEPIRVLNQVFAAAPGAAFIQKVLDFILERNRTLAPKKDYDVLFIGANAALSTAYDRFGKNDATVELLDREESKRLMRWRYLGSWRKDATPGAAPESPEPAPVPRLDRFPGLAAGYYRSLRRHSHETWLEQMDAVRPRTSCLPRLSPWIEKSGIRTLVEAPSGLYVGGSDGAEYVGGDPNRAVVLENRRRANGAGVRFRHVNMLYSRFPRADLFICPDFLEWLSFAEALRVLRRIAATAQPRYLALTGYRLLNESWDTALGDFRPIPYRLPPFGFPEPVATVELGPQAGGRPDRGLMVWKMEDVLLPDSMANHPVDRR